MEVFKKGCFCYRKPLLYFVVVSLINIYLVLSWLQVVPSILHVPIIRNVWDRDFSKCTTHIQKEASLPHHKQQPVYITAKLSGRLGNWLFAYASLLGIAKMNKMQFYTRPDADFRVSLKSLFPANNVRPLAPMCSQPVYENLPCAYDPKMELLPFSNITIHGYLQSWKYFKHAEEDVRKEFTLHDHLLLMAKRVFRYKIKSNHTTCVHVRRTDMMIPSSKRIGFKAAPVQYILNAMNHFRQKFSNKTTFVVISDDFGWCSRNLPFSDSVIIPRNSKEIDLAILSLCNSSIITTGTFGWWGAWLANGYTVYYKNYPEPGTRLDRDMVREDYYPPHWVPMDSTREQSQSCINVVLLLFIAFIIVH